MKKQHLFPLLFVVLTLNTFAQEIQSIDTTKWLCQYNYDYLQDSTSRNSLRNDQMLLQIGSCQSKFNCITHFIADSVNFLNQGKNVDTKAVAMLAIKSISGVSSSMMSLYDIYKNYPKKGLLIFTAYDDHKFLKVEQVLQMNWRLDNQKDTLILGYHCLKASTSYAGRNWVAWYTPQLPMADGPYKFNGLPGLILKISDTKSQHCFTLTSIKKVNYFRPITYHQNEYIDVTAEEYVKIMRNKMLRLYGNLQSGAIPISSEEAKSAAMHRLKAQNNFIEKF